MMSKEKLQESMDAHYSRLVAEQLACLFTEKFQRQWDTVVEELANTRRTNEYTKEALAAMAQSNRRLEALVTSLEAAVSASAVNQQKAAHLLTEALKELGE